MRFGRAASAVILGLAAVALVSCGGGGNSPTTPTQSTAPTPAQASITVTATAPVVTYSSRSGFTYRVSTTATITESAGLGANINYVRMRFLYYGIEIERQEISSADLIVQTGTNRLTAKQTRTMNLSFDTNAEYAQQALLLFNFTDDKGNNLESSFTITF